MAVLIAIEPNDGESGAVRFGGQLEMVHADQYHPLPEQGGPVPPEAGPVTTQQLLPRLFRRQQHQPRLEISTLAVQPGQPRASQSLSPVCHVLDIFYFISIRTNQPSLTQATDTSNIRLVFEVVKETILNNALKDSGIL
jgi:hypothetical protein